ncbi:MAG: ATP-dependent helicase [Spirochaetia bacterium]
METIKVTELNEQQQEAVLTVEGPLSIIAGAGSGKTRVITHRIAHMLSRGIPQSSILALTFTNKAAREMAERVKKLTGKQLKNLTVSTFHSFGLSILKKHISLLEYREKFTVYDAVDQYSLIRDVARELKIAPQTLDIQYLSGLFSRIKTNQVKWDSTNEDYRPMFREYQEHLHLYNAVDFDDLIVLPIKIFKTFPEVLREYRNRFGYIMVDEFQDTSACQYEFMKYLADGSRNICVVGDDDQSIYSWRGAHFGNLLRFETDYPALKEIKLEQNYRSTGTILKAANSIIANNKNRKMKSLWTPVSGGSTIQLFYPDDETAEAEFISDTIKTMAVRDRITYHDMSILIRTNNLSKHIETALLKNNIPYRVSGGTSFFQRKEIKDIIGYLKVMTNPDDDVNLLRIINTPRRGIGKKTLQHLNEIAIREKTSLYSAITATVNAADSPLNDRTKQDLSSFLELLQKNRGRIMGSRNMAEGLRQMIDDLDYWGHLVQEHPKGETARWKYRNVQDFTGILETYQKNPEITDHSLYDFLNLITLQNKDEDEGEKGKVNLMTIHSAKGLEHEAVFLAGVEENIIPHARAVAEGPENLEEERRLFYVAITRAKKILYITSCRRRTVMRQLVDCSPSPFLEEIPEELLEFSEDRPMDEEEAEDLFARMKQSFTGGEK